jgi:hypothetical protein
VAIAVPAVIKEARRRQRLRRLGLGASALAVGALAATWGVGALPGDGGSATTTFRSDEGWTITYPSAFHRLRFDVVPGGVTSDDAKGVSIGNFEPLPNPYSALGVPSTGVLFQLYTDDRLAVGAKNVRFPLAFHDFPTFAVDPAHIRQAGPGRYDFRVDGRGFSAVVIAGRSASRADLRALSSLVSSVRFPS